MENKKKHTRFLCNFFFFGKRIEKKSEKSDLDHNALITKKIIFNLLLKKNNIYY